MTFVELAELLRKRLWLIVAMPVAFALLMFGYSRLFVPDQYSATTSMYVLAQRDDIRLDLSTSQLIANDVARLVRSDRVMREAAESLGMDSTAGYSVSVSSDTNTRVIYLFVTGPDAAGAAALANAIAADVSVVAQEVMDVQSVNVIDSAVVPSYPSGPNRLIGVLAAFAAGLLVAVAVAVLSDMLDTKVRRADDIEQLIGVPVVGRFPKIKKER